MKKRLRALYVIGESKFGGGAFVVLNYMKMLRDHGIEAVLLINDPEVAELIEREGFRAWPFKGMQRAINPFVDIPTIIRLALAIRGKYDIVHTLGTKGGAIGRMAAWMAGVPAVLHTVQGFIFHEFSGQITTMTVSSIERMLAMMTDRMISVNDYDRKVAIDRHIVPKHKITTVYNGINEERLAPALEANRNELLAELNLSPDIFLGVNVGRLAKQKGLRYLFEAIGIVQQRKPELNIHQVVVGDGPLRQECERWVREFDISDRVHLLGFESKGIRWTGVADVFVLSSLWEGHSITLLEAMGCCRPVVATDIKGNRETISHGHNGLLVRAADAEALAEGIMRIASNAGFAKSLGEHALQTLRQRFTLSQMLENTWYVYEELLKTKGLL